MRVTDFWVVLAGMISPFAIASLTDVDVQLSYDMTSQFSSYVETYWSVPKLLATTVFV